MTEHFRENAMTTTRFMLKGPSGKTLEVTDKIVAGRSAECDLVLVQGHPSRRHAQLTRRPDSVWIEDLGSANGTFVNDQQITGAVQLRPGDRIRFDAEQWHFSVDTPPDPEAATVLRAAPGNGHQTVIAKSDNAPKAPGSWADPDAKDGQGTKLFDPKDLQEMLKDSPAGAPLGGIDAPYLSVKSGLHAGQNLKLKAGSSTNVWDIGSDADKDIVISDDGVSGFHAKIVNEGDRWKLIDQMSANGTFVNGHKSNISYLASGDRIRLGPIDCEFQLPVQAAAGPRPSAGQRSAWTIATASFIVTAALLAVWWWVLG
jgi:pSer/pThr/pTyr-binding forkhead associated (FHA) protein